MAKQSQNDIDLLAAGPMYCASMAFLVFLSAALQTIRFDPRTTSPDLIYWWCFVSIGGMAVLYPLFVAELIGQWLYGGKRLWQNVFFLLAPPLRLGARDHVRGNTIWLPFVGWQHANYDLRKRVEKAFGGPMVVIALLVLPLLLVEYFWEKQVGANRLLSFMLQTSTSIIWMAFTIEFITMVGVVEKKIKYCTAQWLDLAIVLLPFVAFLPMLRLGALLRLQQIGKTTRLYRLRGLAIRAYRALLGLAFIRRFLLLTPDRRLAALRETVAEREQELSEIRAEMLELEEVVARLHAAEEGGLPPIKGGDPRLASSSEAAAAATPLHDDEEDLPVAVTDPSGDPTPEDP